MKTFSLLRTTAVATVVSLFAGVSFVPLASAATATTTTTTSTAATAGCNATALADIIKNGTAMIAKRQSDLSSLKTKVSDFKNVTAADKQTVLSQIATASSGLAALQKTLNADTTVSGARADCNNIYTNFRVYLLIVPKVQVVRVADNQIVREDALSSLAANKLSPLVAKSKLSAGDKVTANGLLSEAEQKLRDARALSAAAIATVMPLQPSDYNSNHQLMLTYFTNLKTAHTDLTTAHADEVKVFTMLKQAK